MPIWSKTSKVLWQYHQLWRSKTWFKKSLTSLSKCLLQNRKLELASFLGMCNYLSSYIPRLSEITTTWRQLNKKSVEFVWNPTYEKAFRQAKLHIMNAVTLQYFDPWTIHSPQVWCLREWSRGYSVTEWPAHYFHLASPHRYTEEVL